MTIVSQAFGEFTKEKNVAPTNIAAGKKYNISQSYSSRLQTSEKWHGPIWVVDAKGRPGIHR